MVLQRMFGSTKELVIVVAFGAVLSVLIVFDGLYAVDRFGGHHKAPPSHSQSTSRP